MIAGRVLYVVLFAIASSAEELISVIAIFRHGDRTPVQPYPNDPYNNHSYWPVGWGQLTNEGKLRHYKLGRWFRNRYNDFLPPKYSEKDIYVRSTDVDRTLMSAEANLAGLYPPDANQMWDPDLRWQPIPIHTKPEKEDAVLAAKKPCPRYEYELRALLSSPDFRKINDGNRELYAYVTQHSGKTIDSLESLEYIYNTLTVEKMFGFPLPEWTRSVYPDKMKPYADLSFAVSCYTPRLARLKIGQLLNEIVDHFHNITTSDVKHKYRRKFWMYSGHDTTVANVLKGLGLFENHSPPYASTILFELRVDPYDNFDVQILYKNGSDPMPLRLAGCDVRCPLDDFIGLLDPLIISRPEWDDECMQRLFSFVPYDVAEDVAVAAVVVIVAVLLISALVGLVYVKTRKPQYYLRLPDEDA